MEGGLISGIAKIWVQGNSNIKQSFVGEILTV